MAVDGQELTIPEAAAAARRDPETVRRWIRAGRLPARKVGASYVVWREDLLDLVAGTTEPEMLPLPDGWKATASGAPMPNLVAALDRSRSGR
jgi:excisionase family DNA binding protein